LGLLDPLLVAGLLEVAVAVLPEGAVLAMHPGDEGEGRQQGKSQPCRHEEPPIVREPINKRSAEGTTPVPHPCILTSRRRRSQRKIGTRTPLLTTVAEPL